MQYRVLWITASTLIGSVTLFADFQYEQTTKITGGFVASMGRFAGKQAMEPQTSSVAVKGNRMVRTSQRSAEITDLDKETITHVDLEKKTYSVITFEQMRQAMQDAMRKMENSKNSRPAAQAPPEGSDKAELSFKASVKETGQTKPVNGVSATEFILIMQMIGTDKQSGQSGGMNITNDMWMAPEIKGYNEVRDFERRMGEKMGSMLAGTGFNPATMMRPEMGKGMAEMAKEMSKLKGIPVLQIMRMGATADGQPLPAASQAPELSSQAQMPSAGDMAGHAAGSAAAGAAASSLGHIGGLAGGLGGLGGLGRKKKQDQQQEQASNEQRNGAAAGAAPGGGLLMESTTEMSGFSSTPIDPSKFSVPGGFKEVESEMNKRRGR